MTRPKSVRIDPSLAYPSCRHQHASTPSPPPSLSYRDVPFRPKPESSPLSVSVPVASVRRSPNASSGSRASASCPPVRVQLAEKADGELRSASSHVQLRRRLDAELDADIQQQLFLAAALAGHAEDYDSFDGRLLDLVDGRDESTAFDRSSRAPYER